MKSQGDITSAVTSAEKKNSQISNISDNDKAARASLFQRFSLPLMRNPMSKKWRQQTLASQFQNAVQLYGVVVLSYGLLVICKMASMMVLTVLLA